MLAAVVSVIRVLHGSDPDWAEPRVGGTYESDRDWDGWRVSSFFAPALPGSIQPDPDAPQVSEFIDVARHSPRLVRPLRTPAPLAAFAAEPFRSSQ
jgi:hypothetical protein